MREEFNINMYKIDIINKIQGWRTSWEEKNIDNYLGYYSKEAKYNSDSYPKWTAHKRKVLNKSLALKIKIEDISIFEYPSNELDLVLVKFTQKYSSNLLKNEMIKQQIWKKTNSDWSIIYEGGS